MKDLRSAIPPHLFERSVLKSFSYVFIDLALVSAMVYLSTFISLAPFALRFILWPVYWVACGSVATGLWVIAHECGHQAFSDYKWLNDAVGLVLHSALLVPYHAWRLTHGMHHKNTNHMDRDQVFVPTTRSELGEALSESPLASLYHIVLTVTAGWPAYLLANVSGQNYGRRTNHYEPTSPLFADKHRGDILRSNAGLVVVMALLAVWTYQTSLSTMLCYYFMPYMVVNFFLVTITLLQHTHRDVPHYRGDEWTFIRGALSTVDRSYGWVLNAAQHHIADSHVVHHLFSTMPHYNAVEATKHIRSVLGEYYLADDTNFLVVLWQVYQECKFVEDDGEILFYRSSLADDGSEPSKLPVLKKRA